MTGGGKTASRGPYNTASSCCGSLKLLPAGEALGAYAEQTSQNSLTHGVREQGYLYTNCLSLLVGGCSWWGC